MSTERHAMKIEDLLKALEVNETGLSDDEGKRRLEEFSPNELVEKKRVTPLQIFLGQFTDVFVVMLLIAIGISVAIGELVDASIIGTIVFMFFVYEPLFTSKLCTLGQKLTGIRIRKHLASRKRISLPAAYARIFIKLTLGLISFFTIPVTKGKRAIHDFAVGSVVIYDKLQLAY